jgi:hypothetical protein
MELNDALLFVALALPSIAYGIEVARHRCQVKSVERENAALREIIGSQLAEIHNLERWLGKIALSVKQDVTPTDSRASRPFEMCQYCSHSATLRPPFLT